MSNTRNGREFPLPPGAVPLNNRGTPASAPTLGPIADLPPVMPEMKIADSALTENETMQILRRTLLPEHMNDPNVLRFISNYLSSRDSSQSAREAGLPPRAGHTLRGRPDIHQAIQRLTEKSVMKFGYDSSEVIQKVKEIANIDPIEFLNPDGSFKHLQDMAPEARRAIKKFKAKNIWGEDPNGMQVKTGEIIEIELWDKMKASELLGREKEIFKEKKVIQHDVTENMASLLLESKQRGDERFMAIHDVTPAVQITGRVVETDDE